MRALLLVALLSLPPGYAFAQGEAYLRHGTVSVRNGDAAPFDISLQRGAA